MYAAYRRDTFSSTCDHSEVVDDYREGVSVCIDCGLVVEEQLYVAAFETHNNKTLSESSLINEIFLQDVCDRNNIPGSILADALERMHALTTILQTNWKERHSQLLKPAPKKYKNNEIAAFALYETLNLHAVPVSLQTIWRYTNVSTSVLWSIERMLPSTPTVHATDLIESFCRLLSISFQHITRMKNIAKHANIFGSVKPQGIVAVIIFLYCTEFKLCVTLNEICQNCYISRANMHKIIRSIDKKYKNNISLFDRKEETCLFYQEQ